MTTQARSNSTQKKNSTTYPAQKQENNSDKLNTLAQLCVERIEDLFKKLDVNLYLSGNKYVGECPIHGDGDNPAALNIYYDGHSVPGYWKCRTKGCENKFGKNIIGFARGVLSANKLGYHWQHKPKAIFSFPHTLKYLTDFLGVKLEDIKADPKDQERRRFISECSVAAQPHTMENLQIHRSRVRNNLIIPAPYFHTRQFSADILNDFDVGMAKNPKPETKNRAIVPIYNPKDYLIGYTCRSIFEKCDKCKLFHKNTEDCPNDNLQRSLCSKWRHSGFDASEHLYNFYRASLTIKETNTVLLVEGPGDVWRLHQVGVRNAVCMFGKTLYEKQHRLLAKLGCMTMVILTDNDAAGREGAQEIKRNFGRLYRMYFPNFKAHDIGDLTSDAVTDNIEPILAIARGIYK